MIKLGTKNERGLPIALDYFLCPGEVKEVYGEKPVKLDIRFALNDNEDIFPQYYKLYGQSAGLKAYSDGEVMYLKGEKPGEWIPSEAPSKEELEKQKFKQIGTLSFILPKVTYAGIYQITTSSYHSIVKLNSSIDYIRRLFGRVDGLPLQLVLEPQEAHITIKGVPSKKIVHTLRLTFDMNEIMKFLDGKQKAMAKLSAPVPVIEASKEEEIIEEEYEELPESLQKIADETEY